MILAACTPNPSEPAVRLTTWDTVTAEGFQEDVVAATILTSGDPDKSTGQPSYVVFIHQDGSTSTLRAGTLRLATITSNAKRQIMFPTGTSMDIVAGRSSSRDEFGGRRDLDHSHWSGVWGDGLFVNVFNAGYGDDGYESEIYSQRGNVLSHSLMPDVPGAMGVDGDVLYSLNDGQGEIDGQVTLYETDLGRDDSTKKVTQWRFRGPDGGAEYQASEGLFAAEGRLWFLELINRADDEDVDQESVRLAEVDPRTGKHTSTEVATYPESIWSYDEGESYVGVAASSGHLHAGSIYTADHTGNIVAVDLGTKQMRTVGAVSTSARDAGDIVVAWREGTMTLLYTDDEQVSATLETYDLATGKQTSSVDVPELATLIREDETYLQFGGATTLSGQ